jgi:hypothetical protein
MTTRSSIELDFIKSWDDIEVFYVDLLSYKGWDHIKPVLVLIRHLRALGYDKLLRAGQSVYILVLSRSVNWGLKDNQHRIGIEATPNGIFRVWYFGEAKFREFETEHLIENRNLQEVLDLLLQQPID